MRRSSDAEVLAVDVLHRQERLPVRLADVVDAADVGVRDLPAVRTSAWNRASRSGSRASSARQELQRDRLTERQVVGAVDLAHAAPAEHRDDAVAAGEEGAGGEALAGRGEGGAG